MMQIHIYTVSCVLY